MTEQEAIRYIENYGWSTTRLGLGRTKELLAALDNPQKKLKFIHVAGSNGKGSVCAMFDAILRNAGYKCGLYTSPYIEDFCERIQVDGKNIPGDMLAQITERVMGLAEKMEDHPSQFELVTAIAMEYFYEQGCDIVVLEVGMGGALDSTNAIDAPELACITNIGLEHTEYLGNTLEEIALTKAGIIKPGCSCVCYDGAPEVTNVVQTVCAERDVPLRCVDFSNLEYLSGNLTGQRFLWCGQEYDLKLIGKHQLHNAALVLTGVEMLIEKGWKISSEDVHKALKEVLWPARLELLSQLPVVLLDGGHNPQCAEALTDSLRTLLPGRKVIFLAGVLRDKDYGQITELMLPFAKEFVCVTPLSDRALSGEEFAAYIRNKNVPAQSCNDIEAGIVKALEKAGDEGIVVIFGSLYLAGAARKSFRRAYKKWLRNSRKKAREEIGTKEWADRSKLITQRILESEEFQEANTILIYEAMKGEVSLEGLKAPADQCGKKLLFPRCMDKETMEAYLPDAPDSFVTSALGISEPDPKKAELVDPAAIDLVICPGVVFDEQCRRIGMGAGYYDRYLEQCVNAKIVAAAFDVQCVKEIPSEDWDLPMQKVFTESRVIMR